VKLIFDQNLSHQLVAALRDLYPDSTHVRTQGLSRALDEAVWVFARDGGFAIVTKDGDFSSRAFVFGPPPKVIWLQLGNCTTADVEAVLRTRHEELVGFDRDADAGLLVLP